MVRRYYLAVVFGGLFMASGFLSAADPIKKAAEKEVSLSKKELKKQHKLENYYREKQIKKESRYAFGVSIGVIPDIGNLSASGPKLRNISNEMSRITGLYNQSNANAPAGYTSSAELLSSSKAVVGIPVMFSFLYYGRFFMYRLGLTYAFSFPAVNEFKASQFSPSTGGEVSGLDTEGKEMTVRSSVRMSYFEIMATMALRLVNIRSNSIYVGGGISTFSGGWRRVSSKTPGVDTIKIRGDIPDVDSFASTAVGYHFVIGGEIFVHPDVALTAELIYSRGFAVGDDEVVSTGNDTLRTSSPESFGVTDSEAVKIGATGPESYGEAAEVQYGGYALMIGVRYIL